jgi:hypothetical protein
MVNNQLCQPAIPTQGLRFGIEESNGDGMFHVNGAGDARHWKTPRLTQHELDFGTEHEIGMRNPSQCLLSYAPGVVLQLLQSPYS